MATHASNPVWSLPPLISAGDTGGRGDRFTLATGVLRADMPHDEEPGRLDIGLLCCESRY
jgi:hypothetical protein